MGEVWIPEAEDLNPSGSSGTMSGQGGPRATLHCTVSNPGSFDAMDDVLTSKTSESHLLYDYKTDRLGQYFPLDKSARALVSGTHSISHNKMGSVNIQIEVCAQPVDWTADDDWHPGPNFRAMIRAIRSWGIRDEFVYRPAKSSGDNVRRSWDTFDSTSTGGNRWWGHCHVPSPESHWDPGPLNLSAFFAAADPPEPPAAQPEETLVPFLCRTESNGATYTADTLTRRWIKTSSELNAVKRAYAQMGWDATVFVIGTESNLPAAGVLIGEPPPAAPMSYEDEDEPEGDPGRGEDDGWRRRP